MRSSTVVLLSALAAVAAGFAVSGSADAKNQKKQDRPAKDERPAVLDLRAASFSVEGVARTEKCTRYRCGDSVNAVLFQVIKGEVIPNDPCDAMWAPFGDRRLLLRGRVVRTLRMDGPAGTPIGVHEGKIEIYTPVGDSEVVVFRGEISGTSGFRNASDGSDRCDDPRHEEGCAEGEYSVPALKKLLHADEVDDAVRGPKCRVRLTYEADHRLLEVDGIDADACRWDAWNAKFDGVVVCRCTDAHVDGRDEHHDEDLGDDGGGD